MTAKQEQQQPFHDVEATEEEIAAIYAAEVQLIGVAEKLMASFRHSKDEDHVIALGTDVACRLAGYLLARHMQRIRTVRSDWREDEAAEVLVHTLVNIFSPQIIRYAQVNYAALPQGPLN